MPRESPTGSWFHTAPSLEWPRETTQKPPRADTSGPCQPGLQKAAGDGLEPGRVWVRVPPAMQGYGEERGFYLGKDPEKLNFLLNPPLWSEGRSRRSLGGHLGSGRLPRGSQHMQPRPRPPPAGPPPLQQRQQQPRSCPRKHRSAACPLHEAQGGAPRPEPHTSRALFSSPANSSRKILCTACPSTAAPRGALGKGT